KSECSAAADRIFDPGQCPRLTLSGRQMGRWWQHRSRFRCSHVLLSSGASACQWLAPAVTTTTATKYVGSPELIGSSMARLPADRASATARCTSEGVFTVLPEVCPGGQRCTSFQPLALGGAQDEQNADVRPKLS